MIQLNPPLIRVVVPHEKWRGPTGKGIANFVIPGHHDADLIWVIDLDESGETWCVPNYATRAPSNITAGRKSKETT